MTTDRFTGLQHQNDTTCATNHMNSELEVKDQVFDGAGSSRTNTLNRTRSGSRNQKSNIGSYISRIHDSLLRKVLRGGKYLKLYSYHYLIIGFAVLVTSQQADKLSRRGEVSNVVLDFSARTATTHTPQFLGLPQGAWAQKGGSETAGEGIVIGFVDTGIDPTHPSFSDDTAENPYPVPQHYSGICEVTPDFPSGSCNRKLFGARHFAASAITRGIFDASQDYASPFDGDGHGTYNLVGVASHLQLGSIWGECVFSRNRKQSLLSPTHLPINDALT